MDPDNATEAYTYLLLANVDAAALQRDAPSLWSRVAVVRNDADAQAVYWAEEGLYQAVFRAPGAVVFPDGLAVAADAAALVQLRNGTAGWGLAVTDPTHDGALPALTLRLNATGLLHPGTYGYDLPGIAPRPSGKAFAVWEEAQSRTVVRVELPTAADDAAYGRRAALYQGVPCSVLIPRSVTATASSTPTATPTPTLLPPLPRAQWGTAPGFPAPAVLHWGAGQRRAEARWTSNACVTAGRPPEELSLYGSLFLDASRYDRMGLWVHADVNATGAVFVISLSSDNCSAAGADYFYTDAVVVDWVGWRWVAWDLDPNAVPPRVLLPVVRPAVALLVQRKPVGMHAVLADFWPPVLLFWPDLAKFWPAFL